MLKALDTASPALSRQQIVEVLTLFWFTGKSLFAYNGAVGIELPLKTDFVGGVKGSLFTGLLGTTQAESLVVEELQKGKAVRIRSGGARLDFSLMPVDEAPWAMPKRAEGMASFDEKFIEALEKACLSVQDDSIAPDQLGVTACIEDDMLNLYSTDSKTLTWVQSKKPKGYSTKRALLPGLFCAQMVRLFKEGGKVMVNTQYAQATDDDVSLFGSLIETPSPANFEKVLDDRLPKDYKKKAALVPDKLQTALERAAIAMKGSDTKHVELSTKGSTLRLYTNVAKVCEVDDEMKLDHAAEAVSDKFNPDLILRALPYAKSMLLTPGCIVLLGEGSFVHLVAATV